MMLIKIFNKQRLLLLITVALSCVGVSGGVDLKCSFMSFYKGGHPKQLQITIINNSPQTVYMYAPSVSFYYFWSATVHKKKSSEKYLIRTDMPWVEPPVVRIEESDSLIDTVTIIPNTFHKNGCKGGCTPFINAKGVQFHYAFNGKKDIEKLSLDKKKIHINSEIYVGEISSNKLGLKIIDKNKLQRTFIDPNFDLPIIEIREECCVE